MPSAAVSSVASPWYWPRKDRIIGRPVAARANLSPDSTASVPLTLGATRVKPGGAISTSRLASEITGSDVT